MEPQAIVNILGQKYEIYELSREDDVKLQNHLDGYFDNSLKKIVICNLEAEKGHYSAIGDMQIYKDRLLRHEIIHAFLFESGLGEECPWATEEMIDWLAIQAPKLYETFSKFNIEEK